jgi:hypothetical protein
MPEFEATVGKKGRMKVLDFSSRFSNFFMERWKDHKMPEPEEHKRLNEPDMVFLIGGYDEGEPYGRVFEVGIPSNPEPKPWHPGTSFGPVWGGQQEFVGRLINGYDPNLVPVVQNHLKLSDEQVVGLRNELQKIQVPIPYPFLPLQDCINLSILLIQTTIQMQTFYVGLRGVGGEIDVATITKTGGLQHIREKGVAKLFNQRTNV